MSSMVSASFDRWAQCMIRRLRYLLVWCAALFFCGFLHSAVAQTLKNPKSILLSGNAGKCCIVDLDHDGKADIVTVSGNSLTVLINTGGGNFRTSQSITLSGVANSVGAVPVVGDVNGDGKPDIVVVATPQSGAAILIFTLLGNGDGTFGTPLVTSVYDQIVPSFSGVVTVVLGDLNGDGHLDLVYSEPTSGNPYVVLGDGTGNFSTTAKRISSAQPTQFWIADFNGDGKLDYAEPFNASFRIYFGNGDGTFGAPVSVPATGNQFYSTVADMNKDGHPDFVYFYNNVIYVLLNKGDGTFTTSSGPCPLACTRLEGVADVNSDGVMDLITDYRGLSVLLGQGGANFGAPISTSAPASFFSNPNSVIPIDLDNDGKLDVVIPQPGRYVLFLGKGDGTFASADLYTTAENVQGLTLGDFNGDKAIDIAATVYAPYPRVLLNDGKGNFFPAADQNAGVSTSTLQYKTAAGDFDGDGKLDLVQIGSQASGSLSNVLYGRGDGSFASPLNTPNASLLVGDFNADGKADMLTANYGASGASESIIVNEGQAGETFLAKTSTPIGLINNSGPVGVFDLNGDGKLDVFFVGLNTSILAGLGNGDGTFSITPSNVQAYVGLPTAIARDLDGDGSADVVLESSSGDTIYYGKGAGVFEAGVQIAAGTSVRIADMDGDGRPDLVGLVNGYVQILHNLGGRSFGNATTYVAGDAPVQIQVADLNGDGRPDIVAADAFDAITVLLNLGDAGATRGIVTVSPEPSLFNQPITVSVSIAGVSNTAVPTGLVGFTLDGSAVGSASLVNGAASFTFTPSTLVTSGTHSVGVQYGGDANYSPTAFSTVHIINVLTVTPTITLSPSPATALRSQTIRLFATTNAPDSTITPMVRFSDGGQNLGISPIVNGVSELDTNLLAVGTHTLTATYIGLNNKALQINYLPATSAPATVVISAVPTMTTLATGVSSIGTGSPLTLTAAVSASGAVPFGSVTFFDGSTVLGTSLVVNGNATWTTTLVAAGTHSINAVFQNNETFATSSSTAVPVKAMANAGSAASSLALTLHDPLSGTAPLSLTATVVSASAQDEALSGRRVSFLDGGKLLGSGTTSSTGVATLLSVPRMAGDHAYQAVLLGDDFLQAFESPQLVTFNGIATDFTIETPVNTMLVRGVSTAVIPITLTRSNGFSAATHISCASNSPKVSCTVMPNGDNAASLTISTTAAESQQPQEQRPVPIAVALALLVVGSFGKKRRRSGMFLGLCLAVLTCNIGCGSSLNPPVRSFAIVTIEATAISGTNTLAHGQQIQLILE